MSAETVRPAARGCPFHGASPARTPAPGPRLAAARPVLPPGPKGPAIVQTLRIVRDPLRWSRVWTERYGDAFTLRIVGRPVHVVFSHPEHIEQLLRTVGDGDDTLSAILGRHSLLNQKGEHYLRLRKAIQPPLGGGRAVSHGAVLHAVLRRAIDRWPVGQVFRLLPEMSRIGLEAMLRVLSGLDDDDLVDRLVNRVLAFEEAIHSPLAAAMLLRPFQIDLGPLTPYRKVKRLLTDLNDEVYALIARRRAEGTAGRDDVLSRLIDVHDEHGRPIGEQEIRDQLFTLLMAGHETSAQALGFAFCFALERPEVLARLRAEVADESAVDPRRVGALDWHEAVINETLRITPISGTSRRLDEPTRIGPWTLPPGVIAYASLYGLHHRADLWPDPYRFDPERFYRKRPAPLTFVPFGGGMRRCPGGLFAEFEMKLVLAEVLRRTTLRLAPGYRMRFVREGYIWGPSENVPAVLEARHD